VARPGPRRTAFRPLPRLLLLACIALVFFSPLTPQSVAASPPTGSQVLFHFYDSSGTQLQWSNVRALQENGKGKAGDNDALLNPGDPTVITMWPLYSDPGSASGNLIFDWPGKEASLSLAWPTSDGYSNLIIDVPGPGTYNSTYLATQQEVSALDSAVAARSSYWPSATVSAGSDTAHAQLSAASSATAESQRGSRTLTPRRLSRPRPPARPAVCFRHLHALLLQLGDDLLGLWDGRRAHAQLGYAEPD
jgi:hypothetical protein